MATSECVTVSLPRSALPEVVSLSATLVERMHQLLERNTNASLTPLEREEVETLVAMAQFSQIVAMSLQKGRDAA